MRSSPLQSVICCTAQSPGRPRPSPVLFAKVRGLRLSPRHCPEVTPGTDDYFTGGGYRWHVLLPRIVVQVVARTCNRLVSRLDELRREAAKRLQNGCIGESPYDWQDPLEFSSAVDHCSLAGPLRLQALKATKCN